MKPYAEFIEDQHAAMCSLVAIAEQRGLPEPWMGYIKGYRDSLATEEAKRLPEFSEEYRAELQARLTHAER